MNYAPQNPLQSKVDEQAKMIEQLKEDAAFNGMMNAAMGDVLTDLLVIPPDNMQPEGVLSWLQSLHGELAGGASVENAIHAVNVSLGIKAVNYAALKRVAQAVKAHNAGQNNRRLSHANRKSTR